MKVFERGRSGLCQRKVREERDRLESDAREALDTTAITSKVDVAVHWKRSWSSTEEKGDRRERHKRHAPLT